jgi:hypothetical protein
LRITGLGGRRRVPGKRIKLGPSGPEPVSSHFVLLGRVSPLLRARKVSACGRFVAWALSFATTVANSAITDGNVRRLQKPVGENKVREKEAVRELVILSMCCSAGRAFCRGPYLVRANPRYGRDDWSVAYKK